MNAPGATDGLCAACLVQMLLGNETSEEVMRGVVGGHELIEILGRGGMGTVWRARHLQAGREVALKMISLPQALDPVAERRFRGEIEVAASLEHPQLVPVYEVGESDGVLFYSMKWMRGGSLNGPAGAALRAQGWRAVVTVMEKTARGVAWAHEHGVLHRDLKPANILMDDRGDPAVGDFGLAKMLATRTEGALSLTQSGLFTGTPPFMAPELLSSLQPPTTAADVYGLGAVFYWLLTERPPFDGPTPAAVMRAVVEDDPVRPTSLRPDLPRDLECICLQALEKKPASRYASATAFADDLARYLQGEPIFARAATRRERLRRWAKRHPALAMLGLAMCVGAGAFIFQQSLYQHELRGERDTARTSAILAQDKEREAHDASVALAENLYAADLQLAWQAWENRDLGGVRLLLERAGQPRTAGDAGSPRGFEWRVLAGLSQGDPATAFHHFSSPPFSITYVPSRQAYWVGGSDWIHQWHPETGKVEPMVPSQRVPTFWNWRAMCTSVAERFPSAWPEQLAPRPDERGNWLHPSNPEMLGGIRKLIVTPDAMLAVTAGSRWTRTWSLPGFTMQHLIPSVDADLSMDATGTWLAVGSRSNSDGMACVLNLHDQSPAWLIPWSGGHVALSADGSRLATGSQSQQIRLWDLRQRQLLTSPRLDDWASALALNPDGSLVAVAGGGLHRIWLIETTTGAVQATFEGHRGMIFQMAFSGDGQWLASAGTDQTLRLWPVQGEAPPVRELRGHTDHLTGLAFGANRTELATVSRDHTARLWSLQRPPVTGEWLIPEDEANRADLEISPDGRNLIVPSELAPVQWLDLETGRSQVLPNLRRRLEGWSAEGRLITSTAEGVLEFQHLSPPQITHRVTLENPVPQASCRRLTSDGAQLASACSDQKIRVWDTSTGKLLQTLPQTHDNPGRMAWTRDHTLLATSTYDATVVVYDASAGHLLWQTIGKARSRNVAFSPDGQTLAVANYEPDRVVLFDARSGKITGRLIGHMDIVYQCEWSPDGHTLASIANDHTVRLWHARTQREMAHPATNAFYERLVFAPDGSFLLHTIAGGKVAKLLAPLP